MNKTKRTVSDTTVENVQKCMQMLRKHIIAFCAEKPKIAVMCIILSCILVLPVITAAALMPVAILLDLGNYLSTKGLFYMLYMITFQGVALLVLFGILFLVGFVIASSLAALHSYKICYK